MGRGASYSREWQGSRGQADSVGTEPAHSTASSSRAKFLVQRHAHSTIALA